MPGDSGQRRTYGVVPLENLAVVVRLGMNGKYIIDTLIKAKYWRKESTKRRKAEKLIRSVFASWKASVGTELGYRNKRGWSAKPKEEAFASRLWPVAYSSCWNTLLLPMLFSPLRAAHKPLKTAISLNKQHLVADKQENKIDDVIQYFT